MSERPAIHVGFGVTALTHGMAAGGVDGIGSYTRELLSRLGTRSDIRLTKYAHGLPIGLGSAFADTFDGGRYQLQALPALIGGRSFPRLSRLRDAGVELVHATDHLVPRVRGLPVVATLMDAIPLSHPEWVAYRFKGVMNELWRRSLHWADRVLTISEHSRGEIAHWFRIPLEHIDVVPLGVDPRWFAPPPAGDLARVRAVHDLPEAYFLFVGTLQPRKNLARVVRAHASLPKTLRRAFPLILVGRMGWGVDNLDRLLAAADPTEVRWLRYLPDAHLLPVVRQARALVFPSLCEGFGLPVVEAFAAGLPVITSNTSALPEVAQDAALLVDPTDGEAITDAMRRLAEDAALATQLRDKGLIRARDFSWQKTAEMTLAIYRRLV